jgi:hypothetical protein
MAKPGVQEKISEYLAELTPAEAVADLSDLGVIGYANALPGVTPTIMHSRPAQRRCRRSGTGPYPPLISASGRSHAATRVIRRNASHGT